MGDDSEQKKDDKYAQQFYEFEDLEEYTNYTFSVQPYTKGGDGKKKSITVQTESAGWLFSSYSFE